MINLENNSAVRVLEARGRNQEKISVAKVMLQDGEDYAKISRFTGLGTDIIMELEKELIVQR